MSKKWLKNSVWIERECVEFHYSLFKSLFTHYLYYSMSIVDSKGTDFVE